MLYCLLRGGDLLFKRVMSENNFGGNLPTYVSNKQFNPIWMTVENDLNEDGVVYLSKDTIDSLELSTGDSILIKGKKNRETVCIPHADEAIFALNEMRMDSSIRDYLRVSLGDQVLVSPVKYSKYGKIIHVLNEDAAIYTESDAHGLVEYLLNMHLLEDQADHDQADHVTSTVDEKVDEKKLVLNSSVGRPTLDTVLERVPVEIQSQLGEENEVA